MSLAQNKLDQSLQSGFINHQLPAYLPYLPQFLVNDKQEGKKILSTILQGLKNCDEFWFSVAFVTTSGVATLIETLIELDKKGIKGKILVSQYLNFTQPEALRRLLQFKNIELKIAVDNAFHSKGYLFKKKEIYDLIIGSSNLTATALCSNVEWNLKITATPVSHIIFNAIKEFTVQYEKAVFVDQTFISNYEILYKKQVDYSHRVKKELLVSSQRDILPNAMQIEALQNIEALRLAGKKKALLISATGTGKTYLSAFDVKKYNPKKFLFVVHRLTIARTAMATYQTLFGATKTMGIYSGDKKELDADFVFCTIQTLSKEENLKQFSPEHFDYIVIDETHRAGAESYGRLLNYFQPGFLLGMTATPERTDGLDVFKLFDYNIAYEIRLHKALEEDILSPFHYYGITDLSIDGKLVEEDTDFNLLTSAERVDRIIEKTRIYGTDNGQTRGLIFCSSVAESIELSRAFNQRDYKTLALSGINDETERSEAIRKLEADELDYIFTVDIFNEGIDIPSVNQIVMLRPTQSAIIFVQQLGRGLRKLENKDYLTVIDFIGNYKNNFLVPIALYGDTTYNKDTIRKLMASGSSLIPGASTINFDRIAQEKIFAAIDSANMELRRDLVKDYQLLKFRLGRMPMMVDFLEQGGRDPFLYVNYSKSYFNFVSSVEDGLKSSLNSKEIELLNLFSLEINNAKRLEESLILLHLIKHGQISIQELRKIIAKDYSYEVKDETIESCLLNLNFKFVRKEKNIVRLEKSNFTIASDLNQALSNSTFRTFLLDSTEFSLRTYKKTFQRNKFVDGLIRYNKYSRKDVCRLLNWPADISSTVFGYRTNNEMTPCFVTYHKSEDISQNINYNDHFIDPSTFAWESRSNRKVASGEIQNVITSKRILLFIKKENAEGTDFYFIGDVSIAEGSIRQDVMPVSGIPVVHFTFKIDQAVEDSIYEYLTNKIDEELSAEEDSANANALPFKILKLPEAKPYKNCIPLLDIKVAAGGFSENQQIEEINWIALDKPIAYSEKYFVCQVIGESMNKVIPNGSWCLFKKDQGGSRNGKTVLVQHSSIQDADFGKGYTVKVYESHKQLSEEGWQHHSITLKPNSYNSNFQPIHLSADNLRDLEVVGIFEKVLR